MRHLVFESAVLELPAIQGREWDWRRQWHAVSPIVVTLQPRPAAPAVRVGAIGPANHLPQILTAVMKKILLTQNYRARILVSFRSRISYGVQNVTR